MKKMESETVESLRSQLRKSRADYQTLRQQYQAILQQSTKREMKFRDLRIEDVKKIEEQNAEIKHMRAIVNESRKFLEDIPAITGNPCQYADIENWRKGILKLILEKSNEADQDDT